MWSAPKPTDIRVQWSPAAEAWKIRGRLDGPAYDYLEDALEVFGARIAFRRSKGWTG